MGCGLGVPWLGGGGVKAAVSAPSLDFWAVPCCGLPAAGPWGVSTSMGLGMGDLWGVKAPDGGVFFLKGLISALQAAADQSPSQLAQTGQMCTAAPASCGGRTTLRALLPEWSLAKGLQACPPVQDLLDSCCVCSAH